jgi:hypothetical protein
MQQISMAAADRRPFRRRATTLAVLLMLAGTAEAFDIPTGNPDLALRWDNTFRYNLGFRTQSQDPNILASPISTTAIATSATGRSSPIASTCSPEFDLIYQRKHGFGSAPPDGTTTRTAISTTTTTSRRTRSRMDSRPRAG